MVNQAFQNVDTKAKNPAQADIILKEKYNIQRWSLVMNLSAAAEDAEPRMLGAGEFGYSNDHLKKNMTMNFVLMYNGENKTLLSIRNKSVYTVWKHEHPKCF